MEVQIRTFQEKDAEEIAALIRKTLMKVNSKDYTGEMIKKKIDEYSSENVKSLAASKSIYVAEIANTLVGTATIDKNKISGVFVKPEYIGKGIGTMLMNALEKEAKSRGFQNVVVESSLTAHNFYKRLGYQDDIIGELGIDMHKGLR